MARTARLSVVSASTKDSDNTFWDEYPENPAKPHEFYWGEAECPYCKGRCIWKDDGDPDWLGGE